MSEKPDRWFDDYGNVLALARWLDEDCYFVKTRHAIDFFAKPWKYGKEWDFYQLWVNVTDPSKRDEIRGEVLGL